MTYPGYVGDNYVPSISRRPIKWSIERTDGPSLPSVSVADLKTHLRIDSTNIDEDDLIEFYAQAADEALEGELSVALLTQSLTLHLDAFPCFEIPLPRPPLSSVSSVQYIDVNGVTQILSPSLYVVDTGRKPGRIHLAFGQTFPSTQAVPNAVTVLYTAGRATQQEVPAMIRQAAMLVVGDLYENRERTAEQSVSELPTYARLVQNHRTTYEFIYR